MSESERYCTDTRKEKKKRFEKSTLTEYIEAMRGSEKDSALHNKPNRQNRDWMGNETKLRLELQRGFGGSRSLNS